jgi:hypothetical protein
MVASTPARCASATTGPPPEHVRAPPLVGDRPSPEQRQPKLAKPRGPVEPRIGRAISDERPVDEAPRAAPPPQPCRAPGNASRGTPTARSRTPAPHGSRRRAAPRPPSPAPARRRTGTRSPARSAAPGKAPRSRAAPAARRSVVDRTPDRRVNPVFVPDRPVREAELVANHAFPPRRPEPHELDRRRARGLSPKDGSPSVKGAISPPVTAHRGSPAPPPLPKPSKPPPVPMVPPVRSEARY